MAAGGEAFPVLEGTGSVRLASNATPLTSEADPMFQHRHPHLTALGVIATVGLVVAACGDDDEQTTTTIEGVELNEPGSEDGRRQLPGTGEVGQRAAGTIDIDTTVALDGGGTNEDVAIGVRLAYDAEIVEAEESGAYVSELTITDASIDGADSGEVDLDVASLVGVTLRQRFAADGTGGDVELANEPELTEAQRTAFDAFAGELTASTVAYPAEPVGVGATWRTTVRVEREGFELPINYDYELVELEGDEYTIEVRYDQDIDDEIEADGQSAAVSGTLSGGGTVNGSASNPLLTTSSLTQDLDMTIDADGQSLDMGMDIRVEIGVDPG